MAAVAKGGDVYLFLIGMMLLSEIARHEGLFDWVAARAVNLANGSSRTLFLLIYVVGAIVTTFLSNDATAVVLTPAVYAATRAARVEPLPYLFICAFVANAASFVLPISNPANIVLYADHTPPLIDWLSRFALPSIASIGATYGALWLVHGRHLNSPCAQNVPLPPLSTGAITAAIGIALTAIVLLIVSAINVPLGAPTCIMGVLTASVALSSKRKAPWPLLKDISWSALLLVAGLFILVAGLEDTGAITALASLMGTLVHGYAGTAPWVLGGALAMASNLINNLPAGLIAATASQQAGLPQKAVDALLIGVDLGPNLSVTGSLATILWLQAIRREGEHVGFWRFLKVGALVTPPALILALGARLIFS